MIIAPPIDTMCGFIRGRLRTVHIQSLWPAIAEPSATTRGDSSSLHLTLLVQQESPFWATFATSGGALRGQ